MMSNPQLSTQTIDNYPPFGGSHKSFQVKVHPIINHWAFIFGASALHPNYIPRLVVLQSRRVKSRLLSIPHGFVAAFP